MKFFNDFVKSMVNSLPEDYLNEPRSKEDLIKTLIGNVATTSKKAKKSKIDVNMRIYTTENGPKRGKPLERYQYYKDGITVNDVLENEDITTATLKYDIERKYIILKEANDEDEPEIMDNSEEEVDDEEIEF
jgi:hypothetical protein